MSLLIAKTSTGNKRLNVAGENKAEKEAEQIDELMEKQPGQMSEHESPFQQPASQRRADVICIATGCSTALVLWHGNSSKLL